MRIKHNRVITSELNFMIYMKKTILSLSAKRYKCHFEISVSKTLHNQIKIDSVKFASSIKAIPNNITNDSKLLRVETIDWGDFPPQAQRKIIRVPSAQHVVAIRKSIAIHNEQ